MAMCSAAMVAGVIGVVVLAKAFLFRRRMWAHHHAAFGGYGCESQGPRRWGGFGRHGGGFYRSFWLRALFARLDTTPGQEREIRAAIEELRERARDAKSSMKESRDGLGRAIGGETFDESAFESVSARFDATSEKMKDAFASALRRIHGVLDPKQRERFAALLSRGVFGRGGPGGWGGDNWGGPYRGGAEI
ncbi:MAG: periplasmic heavy metal sensor [Deltaproteobacteria bacterium]|nr:periplasmic heavy metal sensor [Deltaproteobacteria bacterium]